MAEDRVDLERLDGASIVVMKGRKEFSAIQELEVTLTELVEEGELNVIVDMRDAGLIGSLVVGCILGCAARLRNRGGEVRVCTASAGAREVLRLLGVDKFVGMFEDRTGALLAGPKQVRAQLGIADRRAGRDRRKSSVKIPFENRRQTERRGG